MQKVKHPTVKCFSVERKIFSGVYTFPVDENNLKSNGLQKPNQTFSLTILITSLTTPLPPWEDLNEFEHNNKSVLSIQLSLSPSNPSR